MPCFLHIKTSNDPEALYIGGALKGALLQVFLSTIHEWALILALDPLASRNLILRRNARVLRGRVRDLRVNFAGQRLLKSMKMALRGSLSEFG